MFRFLMAVLALIAACAMPVVDPGPNPAKVVVTVKHTISAQTLKKAMPQQGPIPSRAVRLENFLGPFWEIKAEIEQPDEKWYRLPPEPGQKDLPDGFTIDVQRAFLAPPGTHKLRLRLEANINRSWQRQVGDPYINRKGPDGQVILDYNPTWRTETEKVYLVDKKYTQTVTLKAGQKFILEPFKQ